LILPASASAAWAEDVVTLSDQARAALPNHRARLFARRLGPVCSRALVGSPTKDNAMRGSVDFDRAGALFDALSGDTYITISFRYPDGTSDAVRIRGYRDRNRGTPMMVFTRCVHGGTPATLGPLIPARWREAIVGAMTWQALARCRSTRGVPRRTARANDGRARPQSHTVPNDVVRVLAHGWRDPQ
jgi:hypothetical protein